MIPFIDLKTQYQAIKDDVQIRIDRVLEHGQYINGPEVAELEEKLAAFVGVKHCIGASSGTDTLLMAMMALGIGPGDEVITTPFTFIATGEMIILAGATPVFVDIDPRTYNIDAALIEACITPRTRAIMPVSLYGQCADMDAINSIAAKHDLAVIEDAAQSFGAEYNGQKSCGISTIGSTSFFPSKPLGCYGDGGALFTDDDGTRYLLWQNTMIAPLSQGFTRYAAQPVQIDPAGTRPDPDGKPISRIGHEGATIRLSSRTQRGVREPVRGTAAVPLRD